MNFSQNDLNNLLSILSFGRQNAITSRRIEDELHTQFGFSRSGNQSKTRALIKYAITQGYLIKSSTANPAGYWITNDRNEIEANINSLRQRARSVNQSADNLRNVWNAQYPNNLIP